MTAVPLVSVLMPVYRPHPAHFPAAVASVLAQTFRDLELIVIEDPSEMPAAGLLASFNDPRLLLITNPTRTGLIAQRNRTLAEARAEWVAMLDADDLMEPHRLAVQWEYVRRHPGLDVLGSWLNVIDATGRVIASRKYPTAHREIVRAFPRYNAIAQPAVLARKAAILSAGGYAAEFPVEDYDLWSRMANRGAAFANHPEGLTRYRLGGATKSDRVRRTLRLTRDVKRRYWWNEMSIADRLRFHAEGAMTGLPSWFVSAMFRRLTYGRFISNKSVVRHQ